MPVSFSKDIKPMFREVDIDHMKVHGVNLDDYQYMSDPTNSFANAQAVEDSLAGQTMPPGGPFWTTEQLSLYEKWKTDGYQPSLCLAQSFVTPSPPFAQRRTLWLRDTLAV